MPLVNDSNEKKVTFNERTTTKEFQKRSCETIDSDDDNDDGHEDGNEEGEGPSSGKHTLDSDEEDHADKYKVLKKEVLNEIGQEAKTAEFDDDIKLTPFNMKDELDEGDFDTDGHFHWKKNKDEIKDAWLDNVNWNNVNAFKMKEKYTVGGVTGGNKSTVTGGMETNEKESDEESNNSESGGESEEEEEELDDNKKTEIFQKMIGHLKPGETILKAIKRLGVVSSGSTSSGCSSTLSASQRWLKKKNTSQQASKIDPAEGRAAKESLEKLTGHANFFIEKGFYDIYEHTYEKIKWKIDEESKSSSTSASTSKSGGTATFDMFGDEVDDTATATASTSKQSENSQASAALEDQGVSWNYKQENTDESKVFGPFSSEQMLDMSEKGSFGEAGVWCRKQSDADTAASFYNSKRIDFDLYT